MREDCAHINMYCTIELNSSFPRTHMHETARSHIFSHSLLSHRIKEHILIKHSIWVCCATGSYPWICICDNSKGGSGDPLRCGDQTHMLVRQELALCPISPVSLCVCVQHRHSVPSECIEELQGSRAALPSDLSVLEYCRQT